MQIVIHAGMNKTGSTTIQHTFSRLKQNVYTYAPVLAPATSHNALFHLGFQSHGQKPDQQVHFYTLGLSRARLLARGVELSAQLEAALNSASTPLFLLSAEAINGRFAEAVQRLAACCHRVTTDIRVIAYVRPPVPLMQANFEESIKLELDPRATPALMWPEYRRRFEVLDHCFGRDRVLLKPYDRARLRHGCVARDFAAELGVPLLPEQVNTQNTSIGLEATALVYAFKHWLPPRQPAMHRPAQQARFARRLAALSTTTLRFAPALISPALSRHHADLQWLEHRLGEQLDEQAAAWLPKQAAAQPPAPPPAQLPKQAATQPAASSTTRLPEQADAQPTAPPVTRLPEQAGTQRDQQLASRSHKHTAGTLTPGQPINSAAELLDLAEQQTDAVAELAASSAPKGSSQRQRLLHALCTLYDQSAPKRSDPCTPRGQKQET